MNTRNSWPAVVLASVALVVLAGMAILHVDKDTILTIASLMALPVLTALVSGQVAENRAATQAVQVQTNGNQSRLLDLLEKQGQQLLASTPQPPSVPPTPDTTTNPAGVPPQ